MTADPDSDDEFVDVEERSPELGLKYKDLMVLGHLVEAGADMTAPRHVIHYLYFRSQAEARAASRTVEAREFAVEVRSPDEGMTGWAVVCELHGCVLRPDAVRDNTDFFEALDEFELEVRS